MSGKNMLEGLTGPVTQSVESVKALLVWKGRAANPLPQFVEMGEEEGRVVLVLSNKKDAYYTTTARACSCPAATFRHNGPCKHQRKFFPQVAKPLATEPGSIRPAASWPSGMNGPVDEIRGVA